MLHEPESHVVGCSRIDFNVFSFIEEVQAIGVVDNSNGSFKSCISIDLNLEQALKLFHFGSGLLESLFSGVGVGFF